MASIVVNGPLCIAAGAIFPPVCAFIVGIRFYSRKIGNLGYKIDDWLMVPSLILLWGMCAVMLWGAAKHAEGYPEDTIAADQRISGSSDREILVRRAFYIIELMFIAALCAVKLSFMFFFRRVFALRWFTGTLDVISWSIIVYIVLWGILFFFLFFLECGTSFDSLWTSISSLDTCLPNQPLETSFVVTDVAGDLMVIIFPMPLIWNLAMSSKRKWAVTGVFFLGVLSLVASIIRMAIFLTILPAEFSAHPPDEDLISTAGTYFMILELGFAMLAACSACLYNLMSSKTLQRMLHSWGSAFSLSDRGSERQSERQSERATHGSNDIPLPNLRKISSPSDGGESLQYSHDDRSSENRGGSRG